jgi:hypothetical protein
MAMSTTITTLNIKFSQANYNYITINRPASQKVLQSLPQQSSTKCNNNYYKGNYTATVNLANKANSTTTIVAVTMAIKQTTTANTKPYIMLQHDCGSLLYNGDYNYYNIAS